MSEAVSNLNIMKNGSCLRSDNVAVIVRDRSFVAILLNERFVVISHSHAVLA